MALSDKELLAMMKRGWRGGLSEGTKCGRSSKREYARNISIWLPKVCKKNKIKSVCDAGAGDLHWMRFVDWKVKYSAFDLVPRHPDVRKHDITKKKLPDCDAILCRMVLNHMDGMRIDSAIKLFRKSAKFLIATHFVGSNTNKNREFTRLNLSDWLDDPIEMVEDGHEDNCRLAIWEL